MKINSATFLKSAALPSHYPHLDLPEIAFAGRSNVGKSSLINKLLNRKSLAKTSSTPGKTRLINFFIINEKFLFVDLPGYGYAAVSKKERDSWRPMMEKYFSSGRKLKAVVLLQDIRREQTEMDRMMAGLLRQHHTPVILAITKADKLSRNNRIKRLRDISKTLCLADKDTILFSSLSGLGRDDLWKAIAAIIIPKQKEDESP